MSMPMYELPREPKRRQPVDIVKWIATVIPLIGYGLIGMNVVPWSVFAFFAAFVLCFAVGVMWKDRTIMVVHLGASISLLVGYLNA